MKAFFFILFQYLTPQHALSRLAGFIAENKQAWFKNRLIQWFIKQYDVDMSIAEEPDPTQYSHFNDFFTRPLAAGQRPIDADEDSVVSPADGCVSQLGAIKQGRIFQAKGQEYSLLELVGGNSEVAKPFQNGHFATIYLSPKDYHRVHSPLAGKLLSMIHVPGDLFSVNETTAENVPRLFARNERVVCVFATDKGKMAVVLVGAMVVASIETPWAGLITPVKKQVRQWDYQHSDDNNLVFAKGDEIGRFKLGSTAIVLMDEQFDEWEEELAAQTPVKMGEKIGELKD